MKKYLFRYTSRPILIELFISEIDSRINKKILFKDISDRILFDISIFNGRVFLNKKIIGFYSHFKDLKIRLFIHKNNLNIILNELLSESNFKFENGYINSIETENLETNTYVKIKGLDFGGENFSLLFLTNNQEKDKDIITSIGNLGFFSEINTLSSVANLAEMNSYDIIFISNKGEGLTEQDFNILKNTKSICVVSNNDVLKKFVNINTIAKEAVLNKNIYARNLNYRIIKHVSENINQIYNYIQKHQFIINGYTKLGLEYFYYKNEQQEEIPAIELININKYFRVLYFNLPEDFVFNNEEWIVKETMFRFFEYFLYIGDSI